MICDNPQVFAAVRQLVRTTFAATSKFGMFLFLAAFCPCAPGSLLAQTFTTLFLFGGGGSPRGTLVEGTDGNL